MKPVVGLLQQLGIRLIVYLDNMLIMAQSRDIALQHASTALDLLQGLGKLDLMSIPHQLSVPLTVPYTKD